MRPADESARGTIGVGRHAAGVYDDQISDTRRGFGQTGGAQAGVERFSIGAGGAASEVFDVIPRHDFSLEQIQSFREMER